MPTVVVTGASGFIGQPLCTALLNRGYVVRAAARSVDKARWIDKRAAVFRADVTKSRSGVWRDALQGADMLIHLAARVHDHDQTDDLSYHRVNTEGTARLCRLAVECGVRKILFLSTIKVNGETSKTPFSEEDAPNPWGAYARSKLQSELQIKFITKGNNCEYIIIRPPLVYGPQVKANFFIFLKLIAINMPLPIKNYKNRRSMIYVGNLVDAIIYAMENPRAANQVLMVSDGQDRSVVEVATAIARVMGRRPKLFPFPAAVLRWLFTLIGKGQVVDKLSQPLRADISKIEKTLGWRPPLSFDQAVADTVNGFLERNRRG